MRVWIEDVQVEDSGSFVGRCDRVVLVARKLSAANDVTPHGPYSISCLDVYDFGGDRRAEATVAGKVAIIDVLDGVVGVGGANADEFALVLDDFVSIADVL